MVVDRLSPDDADRVFHALADRTRRDIVHRVLAGELSVSALGRHYPISLTAVQKHVAVLESAGLVSRTRQGRETIVRADIHTVQRARDLLDQYEALWRGRIDRMADVLADAHPTSPPDSEGAPR
jgi:DNA-binding transcriptional ArsR family regulator